MSTVNGLVHVWLVISTVNGLVHVWLVLSTVNGRASRVHS